MLREIDLFGGLAPSLLLYFLAAVVLFLVVDRVYRPSASIGSSGMRHWFGSLFSPASFLGLSC
jgi:hypothetical protein